MKEFNPLGIRVIVVSIKMNSFLWVPPCVSFLFVSSVCGYGLVGSRFCLFSMFSDS